MLGSQQVKENLTIIIYINILENQLSNVGHILIQIITFLAY